jgi:hypothetical protein
MDVQSVLALAATDPQFTLALADGLRKIRVAGPWETDQGGMLWMRPTVHGPSTGALAACVYLSEEFDELGVPSKGTIVVSALGNQVRIPVPELDNWRGAGMDEAGKREALAPYFRLGCGRADEMLGKEWLLA